jgi:hypothetical protein
VRVPVQPQGCYTGNVAGVYHALASLEPIKLC